MALHQFDYIFAIAMLFAFLDAFNIGANDVANSFASSISSRSLKYWQAMVLAGLCEFLGAVLAGARVSGTIKNNIIDSSIFTNDPAVLMLTMTSALIGSSCWLTFATAIGMPVSTTHSIVGGTIGAGIAAGGANGVVWGWSGVSQIIASWFIAPILAGAIAAIVFSISRFSVLEVKSLERSIKNALLLVGVLVFATFSILTMLIVWKGSPNLHLDDLSETETAVSIVLTGAIASIVYFIFFYPFYRRKVLDQDWTLKLIDIFRGPSFYFKSADDIPPMPEGHQLTIDYYEGRRNLGTTVSVEDEENKAASNSNDSVKNKEDIQEVDLVRTETEPETKLSTKQYWWSLLKQGPKKWPLLFWLVISHGWTQDVIHAQVNDRDMLSGDLKGMYERSKFYDNRVEYIYSVLQAITAATMSFAHGANDVANATGPLSAVYVIWKTNTIGAKSEVPVWVLAYGGVALVIGCWTYGYNIIKNLGNKMILQSPSRGFSIELAVAITTVMATQLGIPTSTTQIAVGGIVAVGLCNKDLKSVNWRMVAWCYSGWFLTLPIAGLIAGIINGIILNAPRFGVEYQMT
ncbi:BPK_collapsed_G0026430.mRNA.1.CDS.1 [Saccharomyces cerevisiae]|uniref:Phosphate transporter n=1 Tax=Saccharomyces cerevisiae (strain Lalvin EC1118 / Prise de mousse) TaxID=643680 RepID=D3UF43_YEAS8|nr:Pho89p [Saccharomyces cerevisiae YJM1129]EWH19662.1 Pho89p [Saccharomyces cerevisiae P283]CAI4282977.1 CQI_4a_G0004890.mRNA.1.CDS.1 [Saccharomyces cerevisiae]CBK39373.1 Pho89p [Saccharomyces cerevisiae EC1118]CAI4283299.1 CPA_1a_G0004810.mRNA.1.CDS.1 [Saccharomyces cerevisiae]